MIKSKRETFKEFMTKNPSFYEEEGLGLDTFTKSLIYSIFIYRYLCTDDEEKFKVYYSRTLSMLLDRYKKNLALEGIDVDWFVTSYQESLSLQEATTGQSTTGESTKQGERKDTTTTTRTPHLSYEDSVTTAGTETGTVTTAGTETGTVTTEGSETTVVMHSGKDTTTQEETTSTTGTSTDTSDTSTDALASELPNSISYEGLGAGTFPSLLWQTASGQQASRGKTSSSGGTTGSSETSSTTTTTLGTQQDTTDTQSTTVTNNLKNTSSEERNLATGSTVTNDLKNTTNEERDLATGTTVTNDLKNTTSEERDLTTGSTVTNDLKNTSKSAMTHTETGTDTQEGATSGTYQEAGGMSQRVEGTQSSSVKGITTGRSGVLTSTILQEAKTYIRGSSAFMWLVQSLEPCFYAFYDLDEDGGC